MEGGGGAGLTRCIIVFVKGWEHQCGGCDVKRKHSLETVDVLWVVMSSQSSASLNICLVCRLIYKELSTKEKILLVENVSTLLIGKATKQTFKFLRNTNS